MAIILALSPHFIVEAVIDNAEDDECKPTNIDTFCSNYSESTDEGTLESYVCLAHHHSSDLINISTDVTLSSIISLSGFLSSITVSGHKYPTINCINGGGLHLHFCHNCTIKGISWKGCGNSSSAGLKLCNSSNVTIQNCTFQQSVGQAVVLSEVSGNVIISHCRFVNNSQYSGHGAAIHYTSAGNGANCMLTINENSFTHNKGDVSIVYVKGSSNTLQKDCSLSNSTFLQNQGTPLYILNQNLTIYGNVLFRENLAEEGGGVFMCNSSNIIFDQNTITKFSGNKAKSGGAIFVKNYSNVLFRGNSQVIFNNSKAECKGGAMVSSNKSHIVFSENSITSFVNNKAQQGGAIYSVHSGITFKGNSTASFEHNHATTFGGAIASAVKSNITHQQNSTVDFNNNKAMHAGATFYDDNSYVKCFEHSKVWFINNVATLVGGALYFNSASYGTFNDNISVMLSNNSAVVNGGALYSNSSYLIFQGNANVSFVINKATAGAGMCFDNNSHVVFSESSMVTFDGNIAIADGGAVHSVINSNVIFGPNGTIVFMNNRAHHGACLFRDATEGTVEFINGTNITFQNNYAKIAGNSLYIDVPKSCNAMCLEHHILGLNSNSDLLIKHIVTPPTKLELQQPAQCLHNRSYTECKNYYVKNAMLGQEVKVKGDILDYYNHVANTAHFLVSGGKRYQNYSIQGPEYVLISCGMLQGIHIVGTKDKDLSMPLNYTINITFDVDHNSYWKSVSLTVELTPCHPGFWYYYDRCVCYNSSSKTVFCSDGSSTIKRGYWFGFVAGKPTVTYCPITYCNFSCCETAMNGFYHLSPVRTNQCRLHRAGTACGSCIEGFTLPFDGFECVKISKCTSKHLALILTSIVIYWIGMVVVVFAMMYYKVRIGYLYAIIHYYSIVDTILFQKFYSSNGLHTTVTIIYGIVKVIPQFLGQLCLTKNMSGIDQQFIRYIHPLAISSILVAISVLARSSKRISKLISRGIIHVICLILLLSYTSVTTTSLLLMKPLKFEGVDKIFTYLSPDIEYFSGRHLIYGIVAISCIIVIAITFPLLLLLEPFLNSQINFTKIKPLLDQFQECYRDKHRYFASFYMICRLIILLIIDITNLFDESFTLQYVLITVSVLMALVHLIVRPYSDPILNAFDGLVLQLIILVAVLSLVEFYNNLVVITGFILVVLPSVFFVAMFLVIYREKIKNIIKSKFKKNKGISPVDASDTRNPEQYDSDARNPEQYDSVIDDSRRKNATICDV